MRPIGLGCPPQTPATGGGGAREAKEGRDSGELSSVGGPAKRCRANKRRGTADGRGARAASAGQGACVGPPSPPKHRSTVRRGLWLSPPSARVRGWLLSARAVLTPCWARERLAARADRRCRSDLPCSRRGESVCDGPRPAEHQGQRRRVGQPVFVSRYSGAVSGGCSVDRHRAVGPALKMSRQAEVGIGPGPIGD